MKTKNYENDHASEILSSLNKERTSNENFCDVIVAAGTRNFAAHRCVLSSFSPFFKKLLTTDMKEKYEKKVTLQHLDEETLENVLNFIYTCQVSISSDNVYSMLEVANFMDIFCIKDYCTDFLCEEVSKHNCFTILKYAKLYNVERLVNMIESILKEEFDFVVKGEEFKELEFDEVLRIVQTKEKMVSSEENVFYAVMNWIKHDVTTRNKQLIDLFNLVKLDQLSGDFIANVVSTEDLVMSSHDCTKKIILSLSSRLETLQREQKLESANKPTPIQDAPQVSRRKVGMEDGRILDSQITASSSFSSCYEPKYGRLNKRPARDHHGCWMPRSRETVSYRKVGMENGRILDSQITASSSVSSWFEPKLGRLNKQPAPGVSGCWIPRSDKAGKGAYIQIAFTTPTRITGVITQGYNNWFTTAYTVAYGDSTNHMKAIKDSFGNDIIFNGNTDGTTEVINMFPQPVIASYIRLIVQKWNNHPAIRMELLTC